MNIVKMKLQSRTLFLPVEVTITLPESIVYQPGKRKVIWLLHGAGGDHQSWLQLPGFHQAMESRDLIAVMPNALNSDYGSWPDFGTGYDFPKFFFEELMPTVQRCFPVSDAPEDNYVAGLSMGAYGAALLGLLHPEKFRGVALYAGSFRRAQFLEAYRDRPMEEFKKDAIAHPADFPTEYGPPQLGIKRKEVNVISKYASVEEFYNSPDCMWNRLLELDPQKAPMFYLACGTEDLFYPATREIEEKMKEMGITSCRFVYQEDTGHDPFFMGEQFGQSLTWFGL